MRRFAVAGSAVGAIAWAGAALAEEPPPRDGLADWALPGVVRVPFPTVPKPQLSLAGSAGYAFTESLADGDGAHHRIGGDVALGAAPTTWLQVAGRIVGRYDMHPGSDSGAVGEPSLLVRGGHPFSDAVAAGLDVQVRFPGADAPSLEASAITPSFRGLFALRLDGVRLGAYAGYRLDQSANSVDAPERMSLGDRTSLGVSEFDAVLVGAGAAIAAGPGEALGEVTYDLLVGSGAPGAGASPLVVSAGYRAFLGHAWQVGGLLDVLASGRPDVGPNDPLAPVEPRFGLRAVLAYRFGSEPAPPPPPPTEEPVVKPEEKPPEAAPPPVEKVTLVARVTLKSPEGEAVPDATVMLERGDDRRALVFEDGVYVLDGATEGDATLVIQAEGYEDVERPVAVEAGKGLELSIDLDPALPTGQIRGLVRSFAGEPVRASIKVKPLEGGAGQELQTDEAGEFSVNVEPGQYQVEIGAEGYRDQSRRVVVKKKGVVILNADLHKGN